MGLSDEYEKQNENDPKKTLGASALLFLLPEKSGSQKLQHGRVLHFYSSQVFAGAHKFISCFSKKGYGYGKFLKFSSTAFCPAKNLLRGNRFAPLRIQTVFFSKKNFSTRGSF